MPRKAKAAAAAPQEPRKRGEWLSQYRAPVEGIQPGQTIRFDPREFNADLADRDSLRASIASYARRFHKGGKTSCSFNHANGMVELVRVS